MGLLRFLFALSVIIHHSYPLFGYTLVGREPAIRGFFMISGFYMAFILNQKYTNKASSYKLFLTNRLLRIYPTYWIVLFLTILASFIFFHFGKPYGIEHYANFYQNAHTLIFPYARVVDIFRDMTLLGRTDYLTINPDHAQYLVIPQAYTLVLELLFYIVAPFILRRSTKLLVALLFLGLIIRLITFIILRLNDAPLTDRFFPAELPYFLWGSLSYKLYEKIKGLSFRWWVVPFFSGLLIAVTILYPFIHFNHRVLWTELKDINYFILLFICMPFAFLLSSKLRIDRFIGNLSYPMYISHILIMIIVLNLNSTFLSTNVTTIVIIAGTIIFSILVVRFVDKPIDKYRQRRVMEAEQK